MQPHLLLRPQPRRRPTHIHNPLVHLERMFDLDSAPQGDQSAMTPGQLRAVLGRRKRTKLINNGVLVERHIGQMLAAEPGPTLHDAQELYASELAQWDGQIERVVDLFMRLRTTRQAEVAATVHFAAKVLRAGSAEQPTELEVLQFVRQWKERRTPRLTDVELAEAIRGLSLLRWVQTEASEELSVRG